MKQAVIRQAKSMAMGIDPIGNTLLIKFAYHEAKESCVFMAASEVFWLLKHIPPNQDPELRRPVGDPVIEQKDWVESNSPNVLSVNVKQFPDAVRMTFELDRKPDLAVLLDRANLELMRRLFELYREDLTDLDAE